MSNPKIDGAFKIQSRSIVYDLRGPPKAHPVTVGIDFEDARAHNWRIGTRTWDVMRFHTYLHEIHRCDERLKEIHPHAILPPLTVQIRGSKQSDAFEATIRTACPLDEQILFIWGEV